MAREISRAESWSKIHTAFTQVNFNSFDFDSVKESLLNYMKIYYPEDFNDYIESSEFIALLELFAYVAEILAYRMDLNAHENFITTAERKESVLRLAKLISYKSSRNIPARGLVKVQTIQTSENITDSKGRNLSNRTITWNDTNNSDWKEHFILVMNRVMEQNFGSVLPDERIQVGDVLFELYSFINSPISASGAGVFSYSAGTNMELVPVELKDSGPQEKRPERNQKFSFVYSYDGLGDASDTTGFLMFTKQGILARREVSFDGKTPNQTYDLPIENINETDLWVNNVNSDTGEILVRDPSSTSMSHLSDSASRHGEWFEVDTINGENIIFNTVETRHKFETETLDRDQVRLVFGDGEFADIPSGSFDIWYRTSDNTGDNIQKASVQNVISSFNYVDSAGNNQKFTFTFSLTGSLLNASSSEDIERIKMNAPSVYYTQDRMVNGRDYNSYMLQDPSILKLRSINRTFAGDSKYIAWHDPKEYYENVKIFGEDAAVYWLEKDPAKGGLIIINNPVSIENIIETHIEPLLASSDIFVVLAPEYEKINKDPSRIRTEFKETPYSFNDNLSEKQAIINALGNSIQTTSVVDLYYSASFDEWTVGPHPTNASSSVWCIRVNARFSGSAYSGWDIRWRSKRMIAQSEDTKFWNTNNADDITDYDSFKSSRDNFVILGANVNSNRDGVISDNLNYNVIGMELLEQNLPNAGLPDVHSLSILPADTNGDGIPNNLIQEKLLDYSINKPYQWYVNNDYLSGRNMTLPNGMSYLATNPDEDMVVSVNGNRKTFADGSLEFLPDDPSNKIVKNSFRFSQPIGNNDEISIQMKDWVYFTREDATDRWKPVKTTDEIKTAWALQTTTIDDEKRITRNNGRYPINFAWFHFVPTYSLVDPAASNIIDTFIVTEGYYTAMSQWLEGRTSVKPDAPTPLDLRNSYGYLIDSKMISDTVVLQPGIFKILFGSKAIPELRSKLKVIRPSITNLSDNEVKVRIVDVVRKFFDLDKWEFGEAFFFSELSASIHAEIGPEIDSVVIVPLFNQNQFGDMYQIQSRENELFIPDISSDDIEIVTEYTPYNTRQNPDGA